MSFCEHAQNGTYLVLPLSLNTSIDSPIRFTVNKYYLIDGMEM